MVALLLFACSEPVREYTDGHEAKFISVTEVRADYSAFAASSTLTYSCPETVAATSNQAWCTVSKTREGEIAISIAENKSIIDRNAIVSLRAESGELVRIPVSQRGLVCRASQSTVELTPLGNSVQLELYTPLFEISTPQDWIEWSVDGSTLTISADFNPNLDKRSGSIEIKVPSYGFSSTITVEQPSIIFTASPMAVTLPKAGGTRTIVVSSPVDFQISTTQDWINYTLVGDNIVVDLDENTGTAARSGTIEISLPAYNLQKSIAVRQAGEIRGLGMAQKFLGATTSETAWYFDPYAHNGASFVASFLYEAGSTNPYKYQYVKLGRINTVAGRAGSNISAGLNQCIWMQVLWRGATIYTTGYKIALSEGDTDDQIVMTQRDAYVMTGQDLMWGLDLWFYRYGMREFLGNLTGSDVGVAGTSKTYIITYANDEVNPTEMTLTEVGNPDNFFTVTKTEVII